LSSRKEYFQKYYQEHKADIIKRSQEDYEKNKRKHLTYQAKYYILNRDTILAKLKTKSLAFTGHAHTIWNAIRKYAKQWKLPITPWEEFKLWTIDDANYNKLFEDWKESGYDNNLSPVVMRGVKKNGFVIENLKWDTKGRYSWWGEDAKIFKEVEENLDKQQKERNARSKAWRKRIREEWKAKRKGK
jgi:hypothetical protein